MKKRIKYFICLTLAAIAVFCAMPKQADASNGKNIYKISTLEQNTYSNGKGMTYSNGVSTWYLSKITVPANGYCKFQVKNGCELYLYADLNLKGDLMLDNNAFLYMNDCDMNRPNPGTYYRVLPKGTYYLFSMSGDQFKWSFAKAAIKTDNFCRAKALTLKSGTKVTLFTYYGYEIRRWYKITLPKKQKLTVDLSWLDYEFPFRKDVDVNNYPPYDTDFCILNSSLKEIECTKKSYTTFQTASLPKGTYYIQIISPLPNREENRLGRLMWK